MPGAMALRGGSFTEMFKFSTHGRGHAERHPARPTRAAWRSSTPAGLAPGMNPAVRAAVRLGLGPRSLSCSACAAAFEGLLAGRIEELTWGDVEGWASMGGC
jgi:6-phosphofructokinase 1